MLIIINGPLGIGKTTTSWVLLRHFPLGVLLEGDYIAAFQPFDYYNQAHLDYAYQTFGLLVRHHYTHGIRTIIINWVFESHTQLHALLQAINMPEIPIFTYRLRADPGIIADRIRQRNGPDLAFELQRSQELASILDRAATQGDLGTVIDTTYLSVDQTVEAILHNIQQREQ